MARHVVARLKTSSFIISKSDLRHFFFERAMPENLKKHQVSITYGSERPLSLSNICDCLNLLCGRDVSNFVKKPCNFLKVKSRFIKHKPLCVNQLVPEFITQSTDCELSPSDVNVSMGIYCDKLGVFRAVIDNILEKKNNIYCKSVII